MRNEEYFNIFKDVKNKKVLELGCAKGESLKYLQIKGASEVWGIDISEEQLKYAKNNVPSGKFVFCWTHPFFNCLGMDEDKVVIRKSYNDETLANITKGEDKIPMVQYNFKISTIINAMIKSGLTIEKMIEDKPIQENHIGNYKSNFWDKRKIDSAPTTLIIIAKK